MQFLVDEKTDRLIALHTGAIKATFRIGYVNNIMTSGTAEHDVVEDGAKLGRYLRNEILKAMAGVE